MEQRTAFKFFEMSSSVTLDEMERELNTFLAKNRIIDVVKAAPGPGNEGRWSFAVEYLPLSGQEQARTQDVRASARKEKQVDYREVLSVEDFSLYVKLRSYRKEQSEKDGVASYMICTNAELAAIAQRHPRTKRELLEIHGIGEGKWEKYGKALISVVDDWTREHGPIEGNGSYSEEFEEFVEETNNDLDVDKSDELDEEANE